MPDEPTQPYEPPVYQADPASQEPVQPGHTATENPSAPGQPVIEEKFQHGPAFASSAPTADPAPPGEHPLHAPVGERAAVDLGPINARLQAIEEKLDQLLERVE